jgi:hypothetical protein
MREQKFCLMSSDRKRAKNTSRPMNRIDAGIRNLGCSDVRIITDQIGEFFT